ncbi:MAG: replication-relaxation family protein [Acidimicrobiales bacterium]
MSNPSDPTRTPDLSSRSASRVEQASDKAPGQAVSRDGSASGTVVHTDGRNSSGTSSTSSSSSSSTPASSRPGSTRTNWTRRRLDELERSLSERDLDILNDVARFRLISGAQVQALWFGDDPAAGRSARRALLRLTQSEVLARLDRRIGGVRAGSAGHVYRAGPAGKRLLGMRRRVDDEPGLHHLRHTLAVAQLYVDLSVGFSKSGLKLITFEPEPDCWRDFLGGHGESVTLKPDGFASLEDEHRRRLWFIEVDLGTVSSTSLRNKLRVYRSYLSTGTEQAEHGVFPRVVWVTPTGERRRHIAVLLQAENENVGGELHRLIEREWQPPPRA